MSDEQRKPDRLDLVDTGSREQRIDLGHETARLREGHMAAQASSPPPKDPPPPTPGVKNIARPSPPPAPASNDSADE
jgi:hypothetical protein